MSMDNGNGAPPPTFLSVGELLSRRPHPHYIMKSPSMVVFPTSLIVALPITILANSAVVLAGSAYSDGGSSNIQEYCYTESTNLGTCLGQYLFESEEHINNHQYTQQQLVKCNECSGMYYMGDESCSGLKALNEVRGTDTDDDSSKNANDGTTATTTEVETIDWHESFCVTYDNCVNTYCPASCIDEQNAWVECMVLELDCDWRCIPEEEETGFGSGSMMMTRNSSGGGNGVVPWRWMMLSSLSLTWFRHWMG
jgi:hypothetical protein